MNPSHQGAKRVASYLSASKTHICLSCRLAIAIPSQPPRYRSYATTATTPSPPPPPPPPSQATTSQRTPRSTSAPPASQPAYTIKAGIVLSRPPILTPDPHPFETAYHLYQRRLNERLVLPFTQYFYFKPDTPAYEAWRIARKARNGVAGRDVGGYNAFGKEGWNDEALMGDESGERAVIVRKLIDEEGRARKDRDVLGAQGKAADGGGGMDMAGLTRRTEADEKGDVRSLERALTRTLYLLVKRKRAEGKEGAFWSFPSGVVEGKEGLKEAAQRILDSSCGPNMFTWFVGNHPVGHYIYNIRNPARMTQSDSSPTPANHQTPLAGDKTFFMKARIAKGQADPKSNEMRVEDFKWLSKEEIQREVSPRYWASVKNMLVEQ